MKFTVRSKLALLVGIISTIVFLSIVGFLTLQARGRLEDAAHTQLRSQGSAIASQVRRWEETLFTATETLANLEGVRAMDSAAHGEAFAAGFSTLNDYIYTIYSIDAQGNQYIGRSGQRLTGFRGDRSYFQEAMEGAPVSRQILMGRSLDPPAPAVAYGFPILGPESNTPNGVILIASTLAELGRIIGANSLGEDGNIFIVDENQNLIAHPFLLTPEEPLENLIAFGENPVVSWFNSNPQGDLLVYENQGEPYLAFGESIGNGWTVFLEMKTSVIENQARDFTFLGVLLSLIGLAVLLIVTYLAISTILAPLTNLNTLFKEIADGKGDLTRKIVTRRQDETGELARSFNSFVEDLGIRISIIQRLSKVLDSGGLTLTEVSAKIDDSFQSLVQELNSWKDQSQSLLQETGITTDSASGVKIQSNALDEIVQSQSVAIEESSAAAMEMSASLSNLMKVTDNKKKLANEVEQKSITGESLLREALDSIEHLDSSVNMIRELTEIIGGISSQTNLLAMNAAIEAAHAGDAGRGFAVVADEIRKLSESTSESSKEIDQSVQKMIQDIASSQDKTMEAGNTFLDLTSSIRDISQALQEVSQTMVEINQGSNEISNGLGSLVSQASKMEDGSSEMKKRSLEITQSMNRVMILTKENSDKYHRFEEVFQKMRNELKLMEKEGQRYQHLSHSLNAQIGGFTIEEDMYKRKKGLDVQETE